MESIHSMEAFSYGDEWDPISLLFTNEDLELTQRLLGHGPLPGLDIPIEPEVFLEDHTTMPAIHDVFLSPNELTPGCDSLMGSSSSSQEGSYASGFDGYYCPGMSFSTEKCISESFVPDFTGIIGLDSICDQSIDKALCNETWANRADQEAEAKRLEPKRRRLKTSPCTAENEDVDADADIPENLKKRKPRASKSDKGKKTVQPKKKQKLVKPNEDEADEGNVNASPSYSEEDGTSQDLKNGDTAQNSNEASINNSDWKTTTRASRGTATDPQSLYARRRRERINERLKILQNLVPNGTKVDTSTMLEEAVHYVKFLQLQIKLLSSDELWMYAPIAYNGMDIGLNQILPRHRHLLS